MSLAALESQNQRVDRNGFCESHTEDAERKHASEGAWVASHSLSRLRSDKADADAGSESSHAEGETASYTRCRRFCCKNRKDHNVSLFCVFFSHRPQTCTVPVGNLSMLLFLIVSRGELDIDGAEQHEDQCLQQSNQQFEKVKGHRNNEAHHIGDNSRKAQRLSQGDHRC